MGTLTIKGWSDNRDSLVQGNSGGSLVMYEGSKITGNTFSSGVFSGGSVDRRVENGEYPA